MDHIGPEEWVDRFGSEPRKGADILVQCLEREGAYRCSLLLELSQVLCTQLAAGVLQGPLHPAGCWSSPRSSAPSWLLGVSKSSAPSWLLEFSKVLCTQLAAGILQGSLHPAGGHA